MNILFSFLLAFVHDLQYRALQKPKREEKLVKKTQYMWSEGVKTMYSKRPKRELSTDSITEPLAVP